MVPVRVATWAETASVYEPEPVPDIIMVPPRIVVGKPFGVCGSVDGVLRDRVHLALTLSSPHGRPNEVGGEEREHRQRAGGAKRTSSTRPNEEREHESEIAAELGGHGAGSRRVRCGVRRQEIPCPLAFLMASSYLE